MVLLISFLTASRGGLTLSTALQAPYTKTLPHAASLTFLHDGCRASDEFPSILTLAKVFQTVGLAGAPSFMFFFLSLSFVLLYLEYRSCF